MKNFNDDELKELEHYKIIYSEPRLKTFNYNIDEYINNKKCSADIFYILSHIEILIRNNIYNVVSEYLDYKEWIYNIHCEKFDIYNCQNKKSNQYIIFKNKRINFNEKDINKIKCKKSKLNKYNCSNDILSNMSFGFWVNLCSYKHKKIWKNEKNRKELFKKLESLNKLRNRIAHHEPIYFNNYDDNKQLIENIKYMKFFIKKYLNTAVKINEKILFKPLFCKYKFLKNIK